MSEVTRRIKFSKATKGLLFYLPNIGNPKMTGDEIFLSLMSNGCFDLLEITSSTPATSIRTAITESHPEFFEFSAGGKYRLNELGLECARLLRCGLPPIVVSKGEHEAAKRAHKQARIAADDAKRVSSPGKDRSESSKTSKGHRHSPYSILPKVSTPPVASGVAAPLTISQPPFPFVPPPFGGVIPSPLPFGFSRTLPHPIFPVAPLFSPFAFLSAMLPSVAAPFPFPPIVGAAHMRPLEQPPVGFPSPSSSSSPSHLGAACQRPFASEGGHGIGMMQSPFSGCAFPAVVLGNAENTPAVPSPALAFQSEWCLASSPLRNGSGSSLDDISSSLEQEKVDESQLSSPTSPQPIDINLFLADVLFDENATL